MDKDPIFELCDVVRETAFEIHRYLGPGHLEKVYETSLCNRLSKKGFHVERQSPLYVYDEDGSILGEYFADIMIDRELIVEIKAASAFCDEHYAQILGYLRSARRRHGLLINFGGKKLSIRKFFFDLDDQSHHELSPSNEK